MAEYLARHYPGSMMDGNASSCDSQRLTIIARNAVDPL
jgi:hypothetical protein